MEDKIVICLKCRTDNPASSKYCMNCGTSFVPGGKNKWLAAILNLFIPGLGYIYVGRGKRTVFAVGLGVTSIFTAFMEIVGNYNYDDAPWMIPPAIAAAVIFAWDAYQDAKDTRSVR